MCVIIRREPGIIIPEEKISSACKVNPDGFGFSVVDRDKIETIKIHKSGGNDEKEVLKLLEQSKNCLAFLHLRFTTAGKSNEENCHPFTSFVGNNYEIQFMHNGTLNKFSKGRDDDHSDTWHFNEEILKPLLLRFYEVDGAGILMNPLFKTILKEFQGASAFMLYDSEGNHLAIENSSCKQFEGWWASNEYSFNRYHREPEAKTTGGYYSSSYYGQQDDEERYKDYWDYRTGYHPACSAVTHKETTKTTPAPAIVVKKDDTAAPKTETALDIATRTEAKHVGLAVMQAKKNNVAPAKLTEPEERYTFCELAEMGTLEDVFLLTENDLYDLIEELPLAATALMMDLIHEFWKAKQEEKKRKGTDKKATVTPIKGAA